MVLKQNYLSVVACQDMKDALGSIDSMVMSSFLDNNDNRVPQVNEHKAKFNDALDRELHNITLPGEQERADRVRQLSEDYFRILSTDHGQFEPGAGQTESVFHKTCAAFQRNQIGDSARFLR